jgi:hypothetical protein
MELWNGALEWSFGTELWNRALERSFGTELWNGALEQSFGTELWNCGNKALLGAYKMTRHTVTVHADEVQGTVYH